MIIKNTFKFIGFVLKTIFSFGLVSCGSDGDDDPGISITPSSVSMHYDDTKQLSAQGATSWSSNDEFVAKVDQSGLVTGGHVGTTQIIASNGKKTSICDVTITPQYFLYDTPLLDWGISMTSVKSQETHELLSTKENNLMYNYTKGEIACLLTYNFENDKLRGIVVILNYSYYVDAGYYLLERYQPVAESEGMYVFLDALTKDKANTTIGLETTTISGSKVVSIIYIPVSGTLRSVTDLSNSSFSLLKVLEEQPRLIHMVK
jgi:hypothetical protein